MNSGKYLINGLDAYDTYGVSLDYDSLGVLMALPPLKAAISNDDPTTHGTTYGAMPKVKERSVSLTFTVWADSPDQAFAFYNSFAAMLISAPFTLTVMRTGITYHLRYKSSTSFVPWYYGQAKYVLSVIEPNPMDHS